MKVLTEEIIPELKQKIPNVKLLSKYTAGPTDADVYSAGYVNSKLDNTSGLKLGYKASASGTNYVAVGPYSKATNSGAAIGYNASNNSHSQSIALGTSTTNTRDQELAIGALADNQPNTPIFIANVKAGELATDAVNLQQMQDSISTLKSQVQTDLESYYTKTEAGNAFVAKSDIAQELGTSETAVMSQASVNAVVGDITTVLESI